MNKGNRYFKKKEKIPQSSISNHRGREPRRQMWAIQVSGPDFQALGTIWNSKISLWDLVITNNMHVTSFSLIMELMNDYMP